MSDETTNYLIGLVLITMLAVITMSLVKYNQELDAPNWVTRNGACSRVNIKAPSTYTTINYTRLPENVRIYPESHIVNGNEFKIIFENNRQKSLYWGSDWRAEKCVDGEWVEQEFEWAWTAELRGTGGFSRIVNKHNFPFDAGLYRISKDCMLSDVYLRDEKRWRDEFTATFYLIKIQ